LGELEKTEHGDDSSDEGRGNRRQKGRV